MFMYVFDVIGVCCVYARKSTWRHDDKCQYSINANGNDHDISNDNTHNNNNDNDNTSNNILIIVIPHLKG